MENADPKNRRIELIEYLFFGAFVAASVLVSFSELVHLLDSNALSETVRDLMGQTNLPCSEFPRSISVGKGWKSMQREQLRIQLGVG